MLTFRDLLISIAGLWLLCCVQNQTHPHKYIEYSAHSSTEQTLRAAPVKTNVDGGTLNLSKKTLPAPDHVAVLNSGAPLVVIKQEFYSAVLRADAQPKLYRIFHTGLFVCRESCPTSDRPKSLGRKFFSSITEA